MYVIAAAIRTEIASLRAESPALWRRIRRFNLPVQLAVAAADEAASAADDPADAALISLAPCNNGSPELFRWVRQLQTLAPRGEVHQMRVNPTVTLHAVDNLALSAVSIALGIRRFSLGLGGTAGMAWEALEVARQRVEDGLDREVLLIAGDQHSGETTAGAVGVALLGSAREAAYPPLGMPVRLRATRRTRALDDPADDLAATQPHCAAGLVEFLDALARIDTPGPRSYEVPARHGDGVDRVALAMEVG